MVEVERKVRWRVGRTEELLAQHGFVNAAKTVTFVDTYLDDEECTLTARDTWLRRRDAQWELKRPMARHAAAAAAGNPNLSRYEELTEEDDIVQAVEDIFSQRKDGGTESSDWNGVTSEMRRTPVAEMRLTEVSELISRANVEPSSSVSDRQSYILSLCLFCAGCRCPIQSDLISTRLAALIASRSLFPVVHFRTTRRTLRHASNTEAGTVDKPDSTHEYSSLTVVLDEADYLRGGSEDTSLFRVAEVEIVLDSPTSNAVSEAERDVSDFARLLEEGDDSAASDSLLPRGKVERFLALHRPWHLELLRAARQRSASAAKADV